MILSLIARLSVKRIMKSSAEFVKSFKFVIDKHALMQASRKQRRLQSKPWLTRGLLVSIKRKQQLYRFHFLSVDLTKRQFNKTYSKKLQTLKSNAKRNFFFNEFRENSQNPCKTWSIINSLLHAKSDSHFTPSKIRFNDKIASNSSVIATSFNDHFCSIGSNIASKLPLNDVNSVKDCLQNRVMRSIFLEKVTETEIMNYISELKTNKAGGCDEISSGFVKLSSSTLTPVLVTLVNSALSLNIFPGDRKLAKMVPIFKKGDKLNMNNYRPISLLTCLSKIF